MKTAHKRGTPTPKQARAAMVFVALVVMALAGHTATYAWSMHEAEQQNNLQSHTTGVEITETFPDKTITVNSTKVKQVAFENTGTSAAFLRVAYLESWEGKDGEWLASPNPNTTLNWSSTWTSEWTLIEGWYYYNKVLPAGTATATTLESVSFPAGLEASYTEGTYTLDFLAEVVQLSDETDVNADALSSVFGRTAVLSNTTITGGAVVAGSVSWS